MLLAHVPPVVDARTFLLLTLKESTDSRPKFYDRSAFDNLHRGGAPLFVISSAQSGDCMCVDASRFVRCAVNALYFAGCTVDTSHFAGCAVDASYFAGGMAECSHLYDKSYKRPWLYAGESHVCTIFRTSCGGSASKLRILREKSYKPVKLDRNPYSVIRHFIQNAENGPTCRQTAGESAGSNTDADRTPPSVRNRSLHRSLHRSPRRSLHPPLRRFIPPARAPLPPPSARCGALSVAAASPPAARFIAPFRSPHRPPHRSSCPLPVATSPLFCSLRRSPRRSLYRSAIIPTTCRLRVPG